MHLIYYKCNIKFEYNMAKKTIFEGVINGIKFDNVKDYNEYLTKLINAGESFNASTSRQVSSAKQLRL